MRTLFLFFVSLLSLWNIQPLAGKLRCESNLPAFTIADGLSSNSVTTLFLDNRGFLWVGTEDGLNRYDGYGFKIYRNDPSNPHSIPGNFIQTITQDGDQNLWIGTRDAGLCRMDARSGRFTSFVHQENDVTTLPGNDVFGLLVDKFDRLWVKTEGHLSFFQGGSVGFRNYGHYVNVFNPVPVARYPLFAESDTSILFGTRDGLNRFNIITGRFSRFPFGEVDRPPYRAVIQSLLPLDGDHFLAGTNSGLTLLSVESPGIINIPPSASSRKFRGAVNDMLRLDDGQIFLGTHKGLEVFDRSLLVHELISRDGEPLVPWRVNALLQDQSGIVWIGTRYNGLLKLDMTPPKFKTLSRNLLAGDEPGSFNFQSIFKDPRGQLWLGTLNRGIYRISSSGQINGHYVLNKDKYNADDDAVYALFQDEEGVLWAGTNSGLFYFEPRLNRFVEFHYGNNSEMRTLLSNNEIFALTSDSPGNLWIGSRFGLYEYRQGILYSYFLDKMTGEGPASNHINALEPDDAGNIWIGSEGGLDVFNPEMRTFSPIRFQDTENRQNPVQVLSLAYKESGVIVAGTNSGIWSVSPGSTTAFPVDGNASLSSNMVNAIMPDDVNRLWIGTNKGIACVNPDGTVFNFDTFDGLPGYGFNRGSAFKDREGTLYFGGAEGLCWTHPDSIQFNLVQPNIAITSFEIFRKGELLESHGVQNDTITFKFRRDMTFEVTLAALEFTKPSKNLFKMYLEGYDDDWRPLTPENNLHIPNLFPGEYTLKVMACNNDFTWNNNPLELHLIVTAPLWMSNYAYAFYFLILIFIVQAIVNYRVRHYKKINRALKEKSVDKSKIEAQREALSNVNQSLTSSIGYARRIQAAMIPGEEFFRRIFPAAFVYLRPRDIVSGDFYWFHQQGHKVFVAAVDCTGHGVPGAFMSIIGIDILKNLIEMQKMVRPDEILNAMNEDLFKTLRKKDEGKSNNGEVNDGMDIALVVIDQKQKSFEFSGAFSRFYMVRNNEVHTFKGDRFPLGFLNKGALPLYTRQKGDLLEGDVFYLFSDGFPDQFGGLELKKFKYRRFRLLLLNIHRFAFADQKSILHQKIEEWMGDEKDQLDDILVMGFKPLQ